MIEIPKVLKLFGKETQKFPLVFDSPHSGTNYPNDFKYDADFQLIRMGEDTHVNELFCDCIDKGCILLQAEFPRSYIDPKCEIKIICTLFFLFLRLAFYLGIKVSHLILF